MMTLKGAISFAHGIYSPTALQIGRTLLKWQDNSMRLDSTFDGAYFISSLIFLKLLNVV
jgi:hypothetical protein